MLAQLLLTAMVSGATSVYCTPLKPGNLRIMASRSIQVAMNAAFSAGGTSYLKRRRKRIEKQAVRRAAAKTANAPTV